MNLELGPIALILLVVLVLVVLIGNIRIVEQSRAYVVERLGAFHAVWNVGLHFKVPFIMLSDLRESGAIEQDADIVMFLYRDDYYNEDSEKRNIAECIVAKNRHGETGKVELKWVPEYTMNPQETNDLTEFIGRIRSDLGLTVFLIEHHMDLVMDISDRIYVLDFGGLIAKGTPAEIQNNQRVIDAYLGVAEDA